MRTRSYWLRERLLESCANGLISYIGLVSDPHRHRRLTLESNATLRAQSGIERDLPPSDPRAVVCVHVEIIVASSRRNVEMDAAL
jgi:hypothetical protein